MLPLNDLYNMDCMDGMRQFPDCYFDLAIVDPVYGGVTQGGYMTNNFGQRIGSGKAASKGYHAELWKQPKTPPEYFKELLRVSKNQIIWGAITLQIIFLQVKAGLFGINSIRAKDHLRTANLHGLHSIALCESFALCGTVYCKAT